MAVVSVVPLSTVHANNRIEAEFYRPDVLIYLKKKVKWTKIGLILDFIQYGSSHALNEEAKGYKIFRLNEINNCFLTKPEKWVVLPDNQYRSLRLKRDDVLYCRTNGNIKYVGRAGILKDDSDAVFASYLVRVRPKENLISPEYLVVYLNTKVGRAFIERQAMHSNQFNLSAEQLKKIFIPLFDKSFNYEIKKLVEKAASFVKSSVLFYEEAESVFLEELKLKNFKAKYETSYLSPLSTAFGVRRIDAEYFQPAYDEVAEKILSYSNGYVKLLDYVQDVNANFEPLKYSDKIFSYVELADIDSSIGVIDTATEIKGEEAPSRARRILREKDVIVSSVEGCLEKVALVDKAHQDNLASTGFFQLRAIKIPAEVLLILSKSIILQMQLKRECSGTILTAVPSDALRKIVIPILPEKIQKKIASLVQQSHEARRKSKELLDEAKIKVEEAIEKAK